MRPHLYGVFLTWQLWFDCLFVLLQYIELPQGETGTEEATSVLSWRYKVNSPVMWVKFSSKFAYHCLTFSPFFCRASSCLQSLANVSANVYFVSWNLFVILRDRLQCRQTHTLDLKCPKSFTETKGGSGGNESSCSGFPGEWWGLVMCERAWLADGFNGFDVSQVRHRWRAGGES